MDNLTDIANSVEADIAKDNLKELIAQEADNVIESITRVTPGLSTVFKIIKAYNSVKDYSLMEKVIAFLTDLSSMNAEERKSLVRKLTDNPIYGQKFGKFLILAIDRLEYIEKAVYLARICKFYERGDISHYLLIKFKGVIEKVELSELKSLKCTEKSGEFEYYGFPRNFDSLGLYLFQSLDLMSIEHSAIEYKVYNQLESSGKSRDILPPKLPNLTSLGKVLTHIINDKPFDKWLRQSLPTSN